MSQSLKLSDVIQLIALAVADIDKGGISYRSSKPPFREYAPGVGPYSETILCQRIAAYLNAHHPSTCAGACTKRCPDVLIPNQWAIELKLARPFGDNAKEAEHWSQNLLHPYAGNTSSLGDALKLRALTGPESRAVVVVGYEHAKAVIDLDPLIRSFEVIASDVLDLKLGPQEYTEVNDLRHPVHQRARIWAWQVL